MYRLLFFAICLLSSLRGEMAPTLTIAGDIISTWQHTHARQHGKKAQGTGAQYPMKRFNYESFAPFGTNEFFLQTDLLVNYQGNKSWSLVQLQFENSAGILSQNQRKKINSNKNILTGSGIGNNIALIKAYVGYPLIEKNRHRLTVELGRHELQDLFDSRVQFDSNFDGVVLSYTRQNERETIFQGSLAAFVVDYVANKYGYVGEADFYGIRGSKFDLKYSLISWDRSGANRYGKKDALGASFLNSQVTGYYTLHNAILYSGFVHNHKARPNWHTKGKKVPNAFYAGVTYGEIAKKNDFSFDANYQWVQAQSIPEQDVSGIGRFNPDSISMYTRRSGGFANYKGYELTGFYALSDQITLKLMLQQAKQLNRSIGGTFNASTLTLSTTYTF